ncbi:DUF1768-domain-containing protein [Aulographum hederae CBS 113979]|uniref:DUF1768-domain-containing protein n=1 Tax=Aulographum hederae CBS 113979 TaxID=1176131 RepID=A0A6G1H2D6_9PEZI|nr:DUF1768-domain-containing protein [Aulographum hederae CBS 113979]
MPTDQNSRSVYFWREFNHPYDFLSQWYPCSFEHKGVTYRTAEEWMMVSKAKLFGDEDIAAKMLQAKTPEEHKKLGRQVKRFDLRTWDKEKLRIVTEGNYYKFTKSVEGSTLRAKLLATGDRELVEASPFDRIWGVGFGEANADGNREAWGENLLGKAVMDVRSRLREEERAGES